MRHAVTIDETTSNKLLHTHRIRVSTPKKMIQFLFEQGFISSGGKKDLNIEGFMTGIIDLAFRKGGKYYLLDYKSNCLGPNESSYDSESLSLAMKRHDYHLQYLIYTVALHRMLKRDLGSMVIFSRWFLGETIILG